MLVGNAGTGKSVLVGEKLGSLDAEKYMIKNVPFNYYTTSAMLQGRSLTQPLIHPCSLLCTRAAEPKARNVEHPLISNTRYVFKSLEVLRNRKRYIYVGMFYSLSTAMPQVS